MKTFKRSCVLVVALSAMLANCAANAGVVISAAGVSGANAAVISSRNNSEGSSQDVAVAATGFVVCTRPKYTGCIINNPTVFEDPVVIGFEEYAKKETGIKDLRIVGIAYDGYHDNVVIYFNAGG